MSPEEKIRKAALEKEAGDHYFKIFDETIKWCIFKQPEEIEVMLSVFAVDKKTLALEACEKALKKWRESDEEISKRS